MWFWVKDWDWYETSIFGRASEEEEKKYQDLKFAMTEELKIQLKQRQALDKVTQLRSQVVPIARVKEQ